MGIFQYKADSRLDGKIKVGSVNADSFVTLQLGISNELNPSTVNERNIKVLDASGIPQKIRVSYDKDSRTIIVTQKFKCTYNTNYTLLVENVRCLKGYSFQIPLSLNYVFVDDSIASENFQGVPSLPIQIKKIGRNFDLDGLDSDSIPKSVDMLSMILSITSIVALILGLFPFQAISILGAIIWILLSLSLTAVPIVVLVMCNRKKHTHNTKIPKIISIFVLVGFVVMNVLAVVGIQIYFSFMPTMRI